jgi:hypothetical protein
MKTEKLAQAARIDVSYDPVREIKSHMTEALHASEKTVGPESRAMIPAEGPMKGPMIESHLEEGLTEGVEVSKTTSSAL